MTLSFAQVTNYIFYLGKSLKAAASIFFLEVFLTIFFNNDLGFFDLLDIYLLTPAHMFWFKIVPEPFKQALFDEASSVSKSRRAR